MADINKIMETIKTLSVVELNDLVKLLEEEFGVSAAAMVAPAAAAGGDAGGGSDKTEFNVILKEVGANKMNVIKLIKELAGLGLKDAKAIADGAPATVKENVPTAEAEDMKAKFEEAGAKIELK